MLSTVLKQLIKSAFLLFIVQACKQPSTLPYYNTPDFTPVWSADKSEPGAAHHIASFSLTDQDGNHISNETLKGKIHVANFFFSRCNAICPKMTANLRILQNEFVDNDQVIFLSYSVMPWIDTTARLKKYADKFGIRSRQWHLLTGNTNTIYSLARQSYFAEQETGYYKDSTEFLHTEHFILVDKQQRIRGVYNGTLAVETQKLAEDIRTLLRGE